MRKNIILACWCVSSLASQLAHGQILIVDVTNPAAVTFTGTGAFASANASSGTVTFPIWLAGFYTVAQDQTTMTATSTTLETTGAGHTLGWAATRAIPGYTSLVLRQGPPSAENFSVSSPAFTGMATFDLSSVAAGLPSAGSSGNVLSYNNSVTTVVGTYSVTGVPEPSVYGLTGGLACLGFALLRRHRKQSAR